MTLQVNHQQQLSGNNNLSVSESRKSLIVKVFPGFLFFTGYKLATLVRAVHSLIAFADAQRALGEVNVCRGESQKLPFTDAGIAHRHKHRIACRVGTGY